MRQFGLQGVAYQEVFGPAESQAADAIDAWLTDEQVDAELRSDMADTRDPLPEARSLVVLPSRASGAGITVVVEAGQPWPPEVTDRARQTVSELFERTEVDLLVVPSGAIPRTENGKPRRREASARYVLGRS